MTIRIEVTDNVRSVTGIAKATGKPYEIHAQVCYAYLQGKDGKAEKYPARFEINLDRNERGEFAPYPAGDYTVSPASFYIGDYSALAFRPRLVRLKDQQAVRAAA